MLSFKFFGVICSEYASEHAKCASWKTAALRKFEFYHAPSFIKFLQLTGQRASIVMYAH